MKTPSYVAAGALLLMALGCHEDLTSPPERQETVPQAGVVAGAALTFQQMSGGRSHTCALTSDNAAWCWGDNDTGALGTGDTTGPEGCFGYNGPIPCSSRPTRVIGGRQFRSISAGDGYTCAVTTDFHAYCWGLNSFRQLGIGTAIYQSATPLAVAGGYRFRQIDAGAYHTCGVSYPDNRLYCWGSNTHGELGDGTLTPRMSPVRVLSNLTFRQVGVGQYHTCAVTTGDIAYCWGLNQSGQLGDSSTAGRRTKPMQVAGGHQFRQIDAGNEHSCAVSTDSRAWCWGSGRQGQLGNGKTYLSFWPRAVSGGLSVERVSTGWYHSCGETTSNRAWCWGNNAAGELGAGVEPGTNRTTPVAVAGGLVLTQLSAGAQHGCAKTGTGMGYCWGDNFYAALGIGSSGPGTSTTAPVPVSEPQ
jgi:alpha-tubulin suppressor-like RCC1 family protein